MTSFENLDGHGHGPTIEIMASTPSRVLSFLPWQSALDYKMLCARFHHMIGMIQIERDRDTGRVYPDAADGRCRIEYTPSPFDRKNLSEGMVATAKIAKVMGAEEIMTTHPDLRRYHSKEDAEGDSAEHDINQPAFQAWLEEIKKAGVASSEPSTFGSAHVMGTCRMSCDPKRGVVDPRGQVWHTAGLYVADASVFPSASGVNPMVTNMGIADWISRGVDEEVRRGDTVAQGDLRRKL